MANGSVGGVGGVCPQLGLLYDVHIEGHDLHEPVCGQGQRGLGDEDPKLVQQAGLGCREVLCVYLSEELALDRKSLSVDEDVFIPTCKYRKVLINLLLRSATLMLASSSPPL